MQKMSLQQALLIIEWAYIRMERGESLDQIKFEYAETFPEERG